ncbi:glycosyltransferase family 2 protein [Dyadobacter sp. CY343]|uniref:glycosyltransferase family 2 protein n=1 Tax=Dyadobacter sp. CY343 TaxID=2907299 RepID=UPI001F18C416|nr:glycosyltransferase family 2 protein [Dyadobacter sp. CY343]MCE7062152.1 glycosyltransferase family 2 protein [Dyadobacter sp. CY343]
MKSTISVVTIVKSRHEALLNLVKGLELGSLFPQELVIVHMDEPASGITSEHCTVKSFELTSGEHLPLAAARNFAVARSTSSHIIFLDVDCIPATDLVQLYANAFQSGDELWTGPVRYLHKGATNAPGFFEKINGLSKPDPVRDDLSKLSYELFWSLNFGCSRDVFEQIGGFDEGFSGYGAEDTDFSFAARARHVPLGNTKALAYHQHHPSYDPPLNHLKDIVTNAQVFFKKWGVWPMEGWLRKFETAGFIQWKGEDITILRLPDPEEIAAALKP